MWIRKINETEQTLTIAIPLTKTKNKTRIKKRSFFNDYGIPIPTRQEPFSQSCYVEWQIGYDIVIKDKEKLDLTTTKNFRFIGANRKEKTLYELSEYIYYFKKWNIIKDIDLLTIQSFLDNIEDSDFLDVHQSLIIERSHPVIRKILSFDFMFTQVKYPMLVYRFGEYEVLTEIKITEKQYAVGVMPMLYLCFPITELKSEEPLLGRTANIKETSDFIIDKNNINVFLELLKIFGVLSKSHNYDIKEIINTILTN